MTFVDCNWFFKHKGDNGITFLQETHSTSDIENEWSKRTRGSLIMSQGTSNSKGTAILFGSKLNYSIREQYLDGNGRYVIIWCEIQGNNFLLINSYLPNLENDQVALLKNMIEVINKVDYPFDTHIIWGGDFNFNFNLELEASGGNPTLKLNTVETMETIMLDLDLCDIWRIRNPFQKRFTWRGKGQGRSSNPDHLLLRRLYIFISDELQPYVEDCDITPAPSTDHSAITLHLKGFDTDKRGPSFWKFNNSLIDNKDYILSLQKKLKIVKSELDQENILNPQLWWDLIKYEIRKFSIKFSKDIAKKRRFEYQHLEDEIKKIENSSEWEKDDYLISKHDNLRKLLEELSNYITEGIIIRSKATWYEYGEKNNKYVLTLEKRNKAKTHIKKLVDSDGAETTQPNKILKKLSAAFQ